jgi:hypothetical protein
MLKRELNSEMVYSEYHKNGISLDNDPQINAQKSHDFDLKDKKDPSVMHVVQCRSIEDCIRSWEKIDPHWHNKREFYGHFVSKWIVEPVPNRLIVYYHDLVENTEYWVNKVIEHITSKLSGTC